MTMLPWVQTDAKGRFAIAGLPPGHTYVHAGKEDAFYPEGTGPFWDNGGGSAEVEVPLGGEVSGILLKVSPAARLAVKAIDAVTGAAIEDIGMRIECDGSPLRWMVGTGNGNAWLVPTDPIRLRVQAQGYESAWYTDADSGGKPLLLRLVPRQVLTVTIRLRPVKK
jgi:hypothetical protein